MLPYVEGMPSRKKCFETEISDGTAKLIELLADRLILEGDDVFSVLLQLKHKTLHKALERSEGIKFRAARLLGMSNSSFLWHLNKTIYGSWRGNRGSA